MSRQRAVLWVWGFLGTYWDFHKMDNALGSNARILGCDWENKAGKISY